MNGRKPAISVVGFINKMKNVGNKIMEKVKRIQELRRSNAATPIPSKKKYNRKRKHKNKF
jgi:hypothetical protein